MIDAKIYQEQWDRLEATIGFKLYEKSFIVWKKEIEENGFSGDRLTKAIDRIIARLSEGSLRPREVSLGTILSACKSAYTDHPQAQQPVIPIDKIISEQASKASPFAQALIINLKQYLSGNQDKQAWQHNHKSICRQYNQPHYFFAYSISTCKVLCSEISNLKIGLVPIKSPNPSNEDCIEICLCFYSLFS